jgi:hypothetical protein
MKRMADMPMHAAAHVFTRARSLNACVWTIGSAPSAFGTSKAYGTRRLGSSST